MGRRFTLPLQIILKIQTAKKILATFGFRCGSVAPGRHRHMEEVQSTMHRTMQWLGLIRMATNFFCSITLEKMEALPQPREFLFQRELIQVGRYRKIFPFLIFSIALQAFRECLIPKELFFFSLPIRTILSVWKIFM